MNTTQINVLYIAAISNFGLGLFLIIDSLFLHDLVYNYLGLGLMGSPYFHHALIGIFLATMGIFLYWIAKANERRRNE